MTLRMLSVARLMVIGLTRLLKRVLCLHGDEIGRNDSVSTTEERLLILTWKRLRKPFLMLMDQYSSVTSVCTSLTSPLDILLNTATQCMVVNPPPSNIQMPFTHICPIAQSYKIGTVTKGIGYPAWRRIPELM